ncbi:MAG: hypothetical protein ABUS56_12780 [Acidobacteriota bacterium]
MSEQSKAALVAIGGALLGGVVGYLCFTEQGRSIRRNVEPKLDEMLHELEAFRATMEKTATVASQGWALLNSVLD